LHPNPIPAGCHDNDYDRSLAFLCGCVAKETRAMDCCSIRKGVIIGLLSVPSYRENIGHPATQGSYLIGALRALVSHSPALTRQQHAATPSAQSHLAGLEWPPANVQVWLIVPDLHSRHDCQMGRTMKPSTPMARIAALTTNASVRWALTIVKANPARVKTR